MFLIKLKMFYTEIDFLFSIYSLIIVRRILKTILADFFIIILIDNESIIVIHNQFDKVLLNQFC